MKVIILACNKYTWLVPVFMYFYRKYWHKNPYETEIVNEATYLDSGDFDAEGGVWSTWVLNYLKHCTEDKLLLIMEDFMIKAPIDTERVRIAADLCTGNVGCVRLSAPDKHYGNTVSTNVKYFKEYPLNKKYSMSLQTAIWQKSCLLDILREGESAWQTEYGGSERFRGFKGKWRVLWTESTIIDYHPGGLMAQGRLRLEVVKWALGDLIK